MICVQLCLCITCERERGKEGIEITHLFVCFAHVYMLNVY